MNTESTHTPEPESTSESMQPASSTRSTAARPVAIATAIVGGLALVTAGVSIAVGAMSSGASSSHSSGSAGSDASGSTSAGSDSASSSSAESSSAGRSVFTESISGVTGIDIDAKVATFTLGYGDVETATLEVEGPRSDQWNMRREGDDLEVTSPSARLDTCLGECAEEEQTVTLTLPRELEDQHLSVEASLSSGKMVVDGSFGELDLDMNAGKTSFSGSTRSLDVDIKAGDFTGTFTVSQEANVDVAAGSVNAKLQGAAPREVELQVSSGFADLQLPDVAYRVESDVRAGKLDNTLRTDQSAPNLVSVEVAAGRATLRPTTE